MGYGRSIRIGLLLEHLLLDISKRVDVLLLEIILFIRFGDLERHSAKQTVRKRLKMKKNIVILYNLGRFI